ncbi:T9SS type A sorting domain-containing protein [bacterium]|nr:T9SS type A sorting domain-containing protein [bacterium]
MQMHRGGPQDFYLMQRTSDLIQVYETLCGGEVLWDYPIPAQYQSTSAPTVYAYDLTGDGTSEFILVVGLGNRTGILVVEPNTDLVLLLLDDSNTSYTYHSFADYDNDGLGELLVHAMNLSTYQSRLQFYDTSGSTGIETLPLPTGFNSAPAFPNPFNSIVSIPFELEHPSNVEVRIYDVLGKKVTEITKAGASQGAQSIQWDARMMPSGSYFYSVFVNNQQVGTQRVILLK